jgi:hypothetical protein
MENQHRKITGYRELTEADIALMNKIKAQGEATRELIAEVNANTAANNVVHGTPDSEANRWAAVAKTQLQQGYMALTRAVALPTTF